MDFIFFFKETLLFTPDDSRYTYRAPERKKWKYREGTKTEGNERLNEKTERVR